MSSYHTVYEDTGVIYGREFERRRKVREALSKVPILKRRIILEYIEGSNKGDCTHKVVLKHMEGCGEVVYSRYGKAASLKVHGRCTKTVPLSHIQFLGVEKVSGDI